MIKQLRIMQRGNKLAHTYSTPGRDLFTKAQQRGWKELIILEGSELCVVRGTRPLSKIFRDEDERLLKSHQDIEPGSLWYRVDPDKDKNLFGQYGPRCSGGETVRIVRTIPERLDVTFEGPGFDNDFCYCIKRQTFLNHFKPIRHFCFA